ncbi:MAG: oxidoreductase, partial [Tidjanibacter sp.]|nr:oxidoreductase [Tidjanibacter sp.]
MNNGLKLVSPTWEDYELVDSGDFEKLERFGRYLLRRPEPQAIWRKSLSEEEWQRMADGSFRREGRDEERGGWSLRRGMVEQWRVAYPLGGHRLVMRLGLTSFKHVGLFPEQAD